MSRLNKRTLRGQVKKLKKTNDKMTQVIHDMLVIATQDEVAYHNAPANHLPHIDADEYHFDCEYCRRELKGLLKGAGFPGVLFESTSSTLRDAQAFAQVKALILDKVYSFETFEKISELLNLRNHKSSDPTSEGAVTS
jgi:hypothetical protein